MTEIEIFQGSVKEVVDLSVQVPEFDDPHKNQVYHERLHNKDHLILIAKVKGVAAGFKVGYDKFEDGSFYSWMGGVLPEYRKLGVAKRLAEHQEQLATERGYEKIVLKTRNRHKNMLLFAINSGFKIIKLIPAHNIDEHRIVLEKALTKHI